MTHCQSLSSVRHRDSVLFSVTPRLLQWTSVCHCQWSTTSSTGGAECCGSRTQDHITPVLRQLHWLPVQQHIEFKLAVLMFKALIGFAIPYLSDDCQLVTASGSWCLQSSSVQTCMLTATVFQRITTDTSDRSDLRCCRTSTLEQSSIRPTATWPLPWTTPLGVKDTFVLLMAVVPCDLLFLVPIISVLTYLL